MVNKKQFFCIAFLVNFAVLSASNQKFDQATERDKHQKILAKAFADRTELQQRKEKCIEINRKIQDKDGCPYSCIRLCIFCFKTVIDRGIEDCDSEIEAINKMYR